MSIPQTKLQKLPSRSIHSVSSLVSFIPEIPAKIDLFPSKQTRMYYFNLFLNTQKLPKIASPKKYYFACILLRKLIVDSLVRNKQKNILIGSFC